MMWEAAVVVYCKVHPSLSLERLRKMHQLLRQYSWFPDRDSNPALYYTQQMC